MAPELHAASAWRCWLGKTLVKLALFVALALVVGYAAGALAAATGHAHRFARAVHAGACWPLRWASPIGSSTLFGVSFALGAFFAGVILGESDLSHRAAEHSLPLRDAFAVLFFVCGGHAVRSRASWCANRCSCWACWPSSWWASRWRRWSSWCCSAIPMNTALTVAASLAQIGEFSVHPRRHWAWRWGCCRRMAAT